MFGRATIRLGIGPHSSTPGFSAVLPVTTVGEAIHVTSEKYWDTGWRTEK